MTESWRVGDPHPTNNSLVKSDIPGFYTSVEFTPQPLTPDDLRIGLEVFLVSLSASKNTIDWFCRVYGVDPSSLTITK